MLYKPDGAFELKELDGEQEAAYLDYSGRSLKYGLLSGIMLLTAIFFIFTTKWLAALLIYILSNITGTISMYYRERARKAYDE